MRINNATYEDCIMFGEEFETSNEAQNECKRNKQCKGVLDSECNGKSSYLCPQNSTISSNNGIDSCIQEKYAIGECNFCVPLYRYRKMLGVNSVITRFVHIFSTCLFFCKIDPCDRLICNVTNTVCQVVFETGTPFCTCAPGFNGDPAVKCGNYSHFIGGDIVHTI